MTFLRNMTLLICFFAMQGCVKRPASDTFATQNLLPEANMQADASPNDSPPVATKEKATLMQLQVPVTGQVTSSFGMRNLDKKKKSNRFHSGIDVSAPRGTRVDAAAPGVVIFVGRKKAYGLTVEIQHGRGMVTRYAHLDTLKTKTGARVTAGTAIGTVGRTGRTTGANLHFEVMLDGNKIDPFAALKQEYPSQHSKI